MAAPSTMASPQVLLRSPAIPRPRSGMLNDPGRARHMKFGEVAGVATADVAAVALCLPCAVVELAVLAVYKVPAWMCRKAWRKNKRLRVARKRKAMSLPATAYQHTGLAAALDDEGSDMSLLRAREVAAEDPDDMFWKSDDADNEMWDQFYANHGFWRNEEQDDYIDRRH